MNYIGKKKQKKRYLRNVGEYNDAYGYPKGHTDKKMKSAYRHRKKIR